MLPAREAARESVSLYGHHDADRGGHDNSQWVGSRAMLAEMGRTSLVPGRLSDAIERNRRDEVARLQGKVSHRRDGHAMAQHSNALAEWRNFRSPRSETAYFNHPDLE